MWMRPSWDSQYTRTKTEEATTPYYRSSLVGTVICARQLFGDNTVLPHYESHTVNLTKSYSLGLGPGEGGCKGP